MTETKIEEEYKITIQNLQFQIQERDNKIHKLHKQIRDMAKHSDTTLDKIQAIHSQQINEMEKKIQKKDDTIKILANQSTVLIESYDNMAQKILKKFEKKEKPSQEKSKKKKPNLFKQLFQNS